MTAQQQRARAFRDLHRPGDPLVLANVWDVFSARIVESLGARAVATTSGGVAWSHGARDGEQLARHRLVETVSRIVAAVTVPVSADIEGGYGTAPGQVAGPAGRRRRRRAAAHQRAGRHVPARGGCPGGPAR